MKLLLELAKESRVPDLPTTERGLFHLLGFSPRWVQEESIRRATRFNVEIMHRRAGKSVGKIMKLLLRALHCPHPDGRYAYIAPTYGQAEDIAWTYLTNYAKLIPGSSEKISRLQVTVPTLRGSKAIIRLYGVDSPKQRLRGAYLDGAVLDEYQDIPQSVFTEQVRPMLSDENRHGVDDLGYPNQWADFIGTPKGRNQLHTIYQRAELWGKGLAVKDIDDASKILTSNEWGAAIYPASKTGILAKAELESALQAMGRDKYDQEYECSFDAAIVGAIFARELAYLRKMGRVGFFDYQPALPVHTAWDLGWDDDMAIWFFQIVGNSVVIIDYIDMRFVSLKGAAEALATKPYFYGKHLLPHDIEVTEIGKGKTRRSILAEHGVRVTVVPKVDNKQEAIDVTRNFLYRCYFNVAPTLDGVDKVALYHRPYDEKTGTFAENPSKLGSHAADALMTMALGVRRIGGSSMNEGVPQQTSGEM